MTQNDLYRILNSEGIYPWSYDKVDDLITFFTSLKPYCYTLPEFSEKCLSQKEKQDSSQLIGLITGTNSSPVKFHLNLPFTAGEEYYHVRADPHKTDQGLISRIEKEELWKQRGFEIIDTLPLGILIKDLKDRGRYLYCNPRLIELHGLHEKVEDMVGHTDRELYTEDEAERYERDDQKTLEQGRCTYIGQFKAHDRKATAIDTYKIPLFDKEGNPDLMIAVMEDVSETVLIRDELHQVRKMEAMDMLAGGMAHDFNNMLTGIMGYTDLLLNEFDENDPRAEDLKVIMASSQQAASLVNTLLAFSRKQKVTITRINLSEVVKEACAILTRTMDKSIQIEPFKEESPFFIKGDHMQIVNILLNLGQNARDAMAEGGRITIELESVRLEENEMRKLNLKSRNYTRLNFADRGRGIAQEIRDKVFDPFFTTKALGKGTGLGLSTVYSSMKKMEGTVELISELQRGTTFSLYFCPWED